jgi:heterodisulfide reductase subunit B
VRHLLDVLANDIELSRMVEAVKTPLKDMRIAPYYGCQCLRPYKVFDDPEAPTSMEPLISASGARIFEWSMGARCCGAALLTTKKPVGMEFITAILKAAKGADAIATVCPMCQMNLEAFQKEASSRSHEDLRISVLYLPQLLGLAMGLPDEALGLGMNLALTDAFQQKLAAA